jgi:hypothetical protein
METIRLTRENCVAQAISQKNNIIVQITKTELSIDTWVTAVINKKYFNLINIQGFVDGRLKLCDDGLTIFEGFNFR